MNLKKNSLIFTMITALVFIKGLILNFTFFNIFFGISLLMFIFSILLWTSMIASHFIIRVLPPNIREEIRTSNRKFNRIIFICITFFVVAGFLINHHLTPRLFHPLSLVSNFIFLLFTISFGWSLIKSSKKYFLIFFSVFLVFIGTLIVIHSSSENPASQELDRQIALSKLRALPYMSWTKHPVETKKGGVITNKRNKTQPGYNLYTDYEKYAHLIDMNGKIIHSWQFPPIKGNWLYAHLLDEGKILAVCTGKCIAKIDKNSNVLWIKHVPAHHDVEVLSDGTYLVPVFLPPVIYKLRKIRFDAILRLSEDGKVLDEWSCYANLDKLQTLHPPRFCDQQYGLSKIIVNIHSAVKKLYFKFKKTNEYEIRRSKKVYTDSFDSDKPFPISKFHNIFSERIDNFIGLNGFMEYYHLNTIKILPETPLGETDKRFQKGNHLICLRNTDTIFILDKETREVVWSWGPGILDQPHIPTMLNNGNILIYDNGTNRNYSRILEINPVNNEIVWKYKADPPTDFFSDLRGFNQRLSNGNTLICESSTGRVFSVTRDGEIVWEFLNPEIMDDKRKVIYRMVRISDINKLSFLNSKDDSSG
ncbi:aryl-sulfate sulfotransferase [bacterium]|nr:aryl-sulfate sulfotransferase [bacterium]